MIFSRWLFFVLMTFVPMLAHAQEIGVMAVPDPSGMPAPPGAIEGPAVEAPESPAAVDLTAPPIPALPANQEALGLVRVLFRAVEDRRYAMGAGALLMLLVWVLRSKMSTVPKELLPIVVLVTATVPGIAVTLMKPTVDPEQIVVGVFSIFLMASGSWSGIVEPVLKWVKQRAANQQAAVGVAANGQTSAAVSVAPAAVEEKTSKPQ